MSDTRKPGKRQRLPVKHRPETPQEGEIITKRHTYGSTEKILRRCRKIWTRLLNKLRRRHDKEAILEEQG
jgi:hypothetical protein